MANYTVNGPRTIPQIEAELDKIATAIESHLDRNPAGGQANQMEAELDMNSNKITNLAAGTSNTDAVNKSQLDTAVASVTVSSIAHIDEYVGTEVSTVLDIEAACDAVEKLYFGGTDLTVDGDITLDALSVIQEWDLQGSTLTLDDNAQLLVTKDNFIMRNGTLNGGLKQATVSTASGSATTTLTVSDPSQFSTGVHVASSWSNGYLPNSPARITSPNTTLNTISGISGNIITLQYAVTTTLSAGSTNIIPEGTKIFNARFDKAGSKFTGSGTYVFENMHFTNFANAYFVDIVDSTESAKVLFRNCTFDNIPLDQFKFRAGQVVFDNCFCDTPLDIAKQNIVWANQNSHGYLAIRNSKFKNSTRDSFLYGYPDSGDTVYMPHTYIENSEFDGSATMSFTPYQIYNAGKCLHWVSYEGSADNINWGRFYAVNSRFVQLERSVLGTTFSEPSTSFTMGEASFDNCFIDGTPVVVQGSGSTANKVKITNSEIRHTGEITFTFMEGVEDYTFIGCTLKDNFPSSGTISVAGTTAPTTGYPRRTFLENTLTGRRYQTIVSSGTTTTDMTDESEFLELNTSVVNGNFIDCEIQDRWTFNDEDTYFERCKFNYISDSNITRKSVIGNFRQGQLEASFILKGWDPTDATAIDLSDWFLINIEPDNLTELDVPLLNIEVEESNAKILLGGNESAGDQYQFQFIGIRSDASVGTTAPFTYKGAFLYDPPTGSTVEYARDRTIKEIVQVNGVTLDSGTSGASTIDYTSISGGATAYKGDWLSIQKPSASTGEALVRFHEITGISGNTLTIRPNLGDDYTSTANSCLIKHDWLYGAPLQTVEIARTGAAQSLLTANWDILEASIERRNEITYCTTVPSSGTITLPRGKYQFEASASFVQATGNTSTNMKSNIRVVSAGGKFTLFKSASCEDETGSTVSSGNPILKTQNAVSGTFILDDEDTVSVEAYIDIAADTSVGTTNYDSFNFKVTKVG